MRRQQEKRGSVFSLLFLAVFFLYAIANGVEDLKKRRAKDPYTNDGINKSVLESKRSKREAYFIKAKAEYKCSNSTRSSMGASSMDIQAEDIMTSLGSFEASRRRRDSYSSKNETQHGRGKRSTVLKEVSVFGYNIVICNYSCIGYCGGQAESCSCDAACENEMDCCLDYEALCKHEQAVEGTVNKSIGHLTGLEIEEVINSRNASWQIKQPDINEKCHDLPTLGKKPGEIVCRKVQLQDDCPKSVNDRKLIRDCRKDVPPNELTFEHAILVKSRNWLFANKFCAQCHGQATKDTIEIPMSFYHNDRSMEIIATILFQKNQTAFREFIMNYFLIIPKPGQEVLLRPHFCHETKADFPTLDKIEKYTFFFGLSFAGNHFQSCPVSSKDSGFLWELPTFSVMFQGSDRILSTKMKSDIRCQTPSYLDPTQGKCVMRQCGLPSKGIAKNLSSNILTDIIDTKNPVEDNAFVSACKMNSYTYPITKPSTDTFISGTIKNIGSNRTPEFYKRKYDNIHQVKFVQNHTTDAFILFKLYISEKAKGFEVHNYSDHAEVLQLKSMRATNIKVHNFLPEDEVTCEVGNLKELNYPREVVQTDTRKHFVIDPETDFWYSLVSTAFVREMQNLAYPVTKAKVCEPPVAVCTLIKLPSYSYKCEYRNPLEPPEITLIPFDVKVNSTQFFFQDEDVFICRDIWEVQHSSLKLQAVLSIGGCLASGVGLLITIASFSTFQVLQTTSGIGILQFSISLFFAQVALMTSHLWLFNHTLCLFMAAVQHYLWLVGYVWTALLAFDVSITFAGGYIHCQMERRTRIIFYSSLAWICPAVFVGACVVVSEVKYPLYAVKHMCWLEGRNGLVYAFAVPLMLIMVFNICIFTWSSICLCRTMRFASQVNNSRTKWQEIFIHIRLSSLMGFNWLVGLLALVLHSKTLFFVFDLTNTLQGLAVFLSFTATKRIWNLWCDKFSSYKDRTITTGNVSKKKVNYSTNQFHSTASSNKTESTHNTHSTLAN